MSIDDRSQAPYLQIAGHYRDLIRSGALVPGDKLPTAREIAKEWGVARQTTDKALTLLRLEGLVETAGRAGTLVAAPQPVSTVTIAVEEPPGMRVAGTEVSRASVAVASELGVRRGSALVVVRLERTDHN